MEWFGFFIMVSFLFLSRKDKEIKRLRQRIKRVERKIKGENEMSRLLEELKGQKAMIMVENVGLEHEIVDVDEDWVKLTRADNKGNVTTKLVRVDDIQSVKLK